MTGATARQPESRGLRWSLTTVLEAAQGRGPVRQNSQDSFTVLCPVHDDTHPSLGVTWKSGDRGGVTLLYCQSCQAPIEDILDGLGLRKSDLFDEPPAPRPGDALVGRSAQQRTAGRRRGTLGRLPPLIVRAPPEPLTEHAWQTVRTYPYVDDAGTLVQEVIRKECASCGEPHKSFTQQFVSVLGNRIRHKPSGFQSVLYRMLEVRLGVADGRPVWVLEGEKDADTAAGLGLVGTTNAQGARSFPPELAEVLRGAQVRVVLDRDADGYARGAELAAVLGAADAQVQLLLPGPTARKADFTDHVEAGLWDPDTLFGGLLPVSPQEVAAHAALAKVRAKHAAVEQAFVEAQARVQAAEAVSDAQGQGEQRHAAKRWAVEAERRYEALLELVDEVRRLVVGAGTDWAGTAMDSADELLRHAGVAARGAHDVAAVAVPPLLQDRVEQGHAAAEDAAEEPAQGESSTFGRQAPRTRAGVDIDQPVYRIVEGTLVHRTLDKDGGEVLKLVLGIDARVVEMEYLEAQDNTVDVDAPVLRGRESILGQEEVNPPAPEELSAVVIGYTHPATGESMRMRIPALEYRDCAWVDSLPGPPAYDSTPRGIAKLRDALRAVGGSQIRRTVRYRSTGWRRGEDGRWFFVHARGAISPEGVRAVPVLLNGPLSRYDLPDPSTDAAHIREVFVQDSAAMLHRLPGRVTAPLLGQVFRSALGPNPWVLALIGSPGSYKTSVASLAMHHWGELWDRRKPATSMSGNGDTLNALRIKLNSAKDALYWADDVAPTRDWGAAQKALEEFARMVHNGEQRSRSTRDGLSVLDGTPPRSSAMVTSEVMPRPGSGAQRMLVVPLNAEEISLDELIALDQEESRRGRAQLMASFLQWVSGDLEQIRANAFAEGARYAQALREGGENVRQAEAIGATWAGWIALSAFLLDVGAITDTERTELLERVGAGLDDALSAASDPDLPASTGARVRELICHALRGHLAYVDDIRSGDAPPWPLAGRLGWRRTNLGTDHHSGDDKYRLEPKGIRFGYVLHNPTATERVAQLIVDPSALDQVLKATAATMADAPHLDRGTAMRALYDEGVLIAERNGARSPRLMVKRTLHCEGGREIRMVALRLDELLGDEPPAPAQPTDPDMPPDGGPTDTAGSPPAPGGLFTLPTVDDSQHERLVSEPSTPGPTSPADFLEESPMGSYTDATGRTATAEHFQPSQPCAGCGVLAGVRFLGTPMHVPCWQRSTPASRSTAPPASDPPAAPAAARQPASPVPTAAAASPGQREHTTRTASSSAVFAGPAAVLHTDGIWMPDGTHRDLPQPLSHVGHIAALVDELHLGTQVTSYRSEPGQIWVTDAMLRQLDIDTTDLDKGDSTRGTQLRERTAESVLVTAAREEGWKLGGKGGDRLGTWTRVWRGEKRGVFVALISGMSPDPSETPVLSDDPAPATLARRLGLFAAAVGAPWAMSGSTTGIDLMISLRAKDRDKLFTPHEPVPPAAMNTLESDFRWSRKPTEAEAAHRYVHGYDRGGSYAAGVAGLELGVGTPTHHPDGVAFDPKLPGYWKVEIPDAADWRYPHPLNPRGSTPSMWVTTPTLAMGYELGYEQPVLQAYTWSEHLRILDPWYARVRDARTQLDIDDVDAQAARDMLKVVYAHTFGMMGSELHMRNRMGYAPDRRHHIVAKARANVLRRILQIGRDSDRWPVAVTADTVLYTSDDPDPISAWPGKSNTLGRGFGQYKAEASGLLVEQLAHLGTGNGYRGKDLLDTEWDPAAAGGA